MQMKIVLDPPTIDSKDPTKLSQFDSSQTRARNMILRYASDHSIL